MQTSVSESDRGLEVLVCWTLNANVSLKTKLKDKLAITFLSDVIFNVVCLTFPDSIMFSDVFFSLQSDLVVALW